MRLADLAARRVAIWGYGREGRAALAALRARVPATNVTVLCTPAEADAVRADAAQLGGAPVGVDARPVDAATLGAFDVVIKSPGISAYRPDIAAARVNGTQFTSGTALWFAENPTARTIAVTGTKGKSTTTALVAHLLRRAGRRVALAGNIGLPLLELLDAAPQPEWWAIELSSFQTRDAAGVAIGAITNLYDEHLDWHGTRERYADDKLALADRARVLVVNALQPELTTRTAAHAQRRPFGTREAWHVRSTGDDVAIWRGDRRVLGADAIALPGAHNALNVCAALSVVEAAGEDAIGAAAHVSSFRPLPHRLQPLGERDGVRWVDDSIATTPQATLEALASVGAAGTTVLVGGFDRGLDWAPFADAVARTPPHAIVAFGALGARVFAILRASAPRYALERRESLEDAVKAARAATPRGGAIVLSPGAPSFDAFRDYAERGRAFAALGGFAGEGSDRIDGLGIA